MGGFGYFLKSTLFSGRHPEIIPLVSAIALCGVCAVFISVDNLFYNPTVVALKSEREAYSRNERQRDYEDRPFLKLVKPLRDRPISFISPNDENSRIPH